MSGTRGSADKQFIAAVAAGSAVAGAAIAVAAMKMLSKNNNLERKSRSSVALYNQDKDDYIVMTRKESQVILPHNHEEKMRRRIAQRVAVEQENSTPRKSVTVKVPATSANFGPGCTFRNPRCLIMMFQILLTNLNFFTQL